ncbi:hypothetical protein [Methylophaga sp. OBS3]|uniref:hypothetical protein n=1 Tax=Methylophaga sp. OBS3 TaxID=2991934 RepID=UPI0022586670|nr:hypothetical protein [Methylophaga sp. OBS3]MCX4188897.1 hypothetical protein [Methylophaga sp. OBS3]
MSEINKTNSPSQLNQPNRRKMTRRQGVDRREMFRFDLTKTDRRSGHDRRDNANNSWGSDDPI